jgi:pyruvate dehydrogenase complex dehydrogenase (E1) component
LTATETQEWLEAFEAIVEREGAERAKFILQALKPIMLIVLVCSYHA